MTPSQTRRAARKKAFENIAPLNAALHARNVDSYTGGKDSNPWRVIRGATGFYGMQIDNRPGQSRKDETSDE